MRTSKLAELLVTFLGGLALTGSAAGTLPFQPESRLWVEGTSTVRDFTCRATEVQGDVILDDGQGSMAIAGLAARVGGAEVVVPVAAIKCGNGTMDDHLRRALRATEHPVVEFEVTDLRVTSGAGREGGLVITGDLRIAGRERVTTIDAVASQEADGALRVRGSRELAMTDFGIKPPSLMMGTMKVKDRVVVQFDVLLRP